MRLLGETDQYDIVITEIGGTVGDIESLPYIESVRQMIWDLRKRKRNRNSSYPHSISCCCRRIEDKTHPTFG